MKKLLHLFILIVMMFNMLTIGVYAIDNNANDIVLNRKEYALSKIKYTYDIWFTIPIGQSDFERQKSKAKFIPHNPETFIWVVIEPGTPR